LNHYAEARVERLLSRNLVAYLASRFCSGVAMTMLRAAVAWHVFDLSRSAFHLGLIGLVQFVPALLLTLIGGAVADTYDRRRVCMIAQSVPIACCGVLFAATRQGAITLELLYAMILVVSVAQTFGNPARAALLPSIVPRESFPRAVTIASTVQALAFVSGPTACGFVIAGAGIGAVYGAYELLAAGSLIGLAFLRPAPVEGGRRAMSWEAVRSGLAYVRRQPVVLGCMTLDMFAVIFGGATALLPIYATEILQVGARGYGVLSASLEAGALVSAIAMLALPPIRRAGSALLVAVTVYGVATIVFGLSQWFPLSVAAYALVGVADQVSVVMRGTAIQLSTPDELRGRVSSVNFLFIGASNQLGAVESGFVAALTSAPFAVVSGGVGCLIVVAVVAATLPALRAYRLDQTRPAP
jgi:MFS family permease